MFMNVYFCCFFVLCCFVFVFALFSPSSTSNKSLFSLVILVKLSLTGMESLAEQVNSPSPHTLPAFSCVSRAVLGILSHGLF